MKGFNIRYWPNILNKGNVHPAFIKSQEYGGDAVKRAIIIVLIRVLIIGGTLVVAALKVNCPKC